MAEFADGSQPISSDGVALMLPGARPRFLEASGNNRGGQVPTVAVEGPDGRLTQPGAAREFTFRDAFGFTELDEGSR